MKKRLIISFILTILLFGFVLFIEVDLKKTPTLNQIISWLKNDEQYRKEAPEVKEITIQKVLEPSQTINSYLRENPKLRRGSQRLYDKLIFTDYFFCCNEISWSQLGNKPFGYIEANGNNIVFVTGYGDIFTFESDDLEDKENIIIKRKNSNIENIVKNNSIFEKEMDGIRGIDIFNNHLYVSYMEKINECYSINVLIADLKNEEIKFEKFFEPSECLDERGDEPLAYAAGGGKIEITKDGTVYLSVGNFEAYSKSQNPKSVYGKIIKILSIQSYEIVSLGHRNPQGLSETQDSNYLISTEHGPWGGDEINLINKQEVLNFGWPLVSYGRHYEEIDNEKLKDVAPLKKPHKDYGFEEPIYWVDYSPFGISDIIINHFREESNSFFVGTLNKNHIYEITFTNGFKNISEINSIRTSNRLRDMTYDQTNKRYVVLFEQPPMLTTIERVQTDK